MLKTILTVAVLATSVLAQPTAPNPIVTPGNPPVTIPGNTPGETVTLSVWLNESANGITRDPDEQYEATADANGDAHFNPHIPQGTDMVTFGEGVPETWQETTTSPCVYSPEAAMQYAAMQIFFAFVGINIFDAGEGEVQVHLLQTIATGELFFIYEYPDGTFEVEYL